MISVYLIRHAESEGNVNHHLIGGQSNHLPLTERGIQQAHLLGKRLASEHMQFDKIVSSTAVRALHTARTSLPYIGQETQIETTEKILEVGQGEWEGMERAEIYTPAVRQQMASNPWNFHAPGGESLLDVVRRMRSWLDEVINGLDPQQPYRIAGYSHGFAIRTLVANLLETSPLIARNMATHNTSMTLLQYNGRRWLVERMNDAAHLAGTSFIGHY